MSVSPAVREYLNDTGREFQVLSHRKAFTTIDEARTMGINADELAKTLVISVRGQLSLLVLPGAHRMDNRKLRQIYNDKHARLATEDELREAFPGFELGAVPPLGDMLGLDMYLDKSFLFHDKVVFSGGTHSDSVLMNCSDFINLGNPVLVDAVASAAA